MEVAVYDTHVVKKDGQTMHFDVVVPKEESPDGVFDFGREYLKSAGQEGQPLTAKECEFCHIERASEKIENAIKQRGYFIKEMEGCL
jgi:Domain of unknown function (DUF2024)